MEDYATDPFARARARFDVLTEELAGPLTASFTHAELEELLRIEGRELLRQLHQDHLDLHAAREERRDDVTGADGIARTRVEAGHTRQLATVFGPVTVTRQAYRAPGAANLHPADAELNLPAEKHSHGLRRLAALEAARGSYDAAAAAIERATGTFLGKRQLQELAQRAAVDFEVFYRQRISVLHGDDHLLVLTFDGKGIVMRPEALRAATAKKARAKGGNKLTTRLSSGEKLGRKRMAELGAVYTAAPAPRTAADVIHTPGTAGADRVAGPVATDKWVTGSVVADTAAVVTAVFDEAQRRDPTRSRTWVVLVDGHKHQLDRIRAEAQARGVTVHIVIDIIHVLEYLWGAAWCFHAPGDPAAETWVARQATAVLEGGASVVAAAIRRTATKRNLTAARRKGADKAAAYLLAKKHHLRYDQALKAGWPIATGIIEGACRYLVKDRMDITGARWGLAGAEAVLHLRALVSNGDFDAYWRFHLAREQQRIHHSRYRQQREDYALAA